LGRSVEVSQRLCRIYRDLRLVPRELQWSLNSAKPQEVLKHSLDLRLREFLGVGVDARDGLTAFGRDDVVVQGEAVEHSDVVRDVARPILVGVRRGAFAGKVQVSQHALVGQESGPEMTLAPTLIVGDPHVSPATIEAMVCVAADLFLLHLTPLTLACFSTRPEA
jgi:hypothetical protein